MEKLIEAYFKHIDSYLSDKPIYSYDERGSLIFVEFGGCCTHNGCETVEVSYSDLLVFLFERQEG